jgi:hypothetical protein
MLTAKKKTHLNNFQIYNKTNIKLYIKFFCKRVKLILSLKIKKIKNTKTFLTNRYYIFFILGLNLYFYYAKRNVQFNLI